MDVVDSAVCVLGFGGCTPAHRHVHPAWGVGFWKLWDPLYVWLEHAVGLEGLDPPAVFAAAAAAAAAVEGCEASDLPASFAGGAPVSPAGGTHRGPEAPVTIEDARALPACFAAGVRHCRPTRGVVLLCSLRPDIPYGRIPFERLGPSLLAEALAACVRGRNVGALRQGLREGHVAPAALLAGGVGNVPDPCAALALLHTGVGLTPADFRAGTNWACRWACRAGNLGAVEYLHRHVGLAAADFRAGGNEACAQACANGHLEVVVYLHRLVGLTADDFRAMEGMACETACGNGHLRVAAYLHLSVGLTADDFRTRENSACRGACGNGHLGVVEYLHTHVGLAARDFRAGVRSAWMNGHAAVLRYLRGPVGCTGLNLP